MAPAPKAMRGAVPFVPMDQDSPIQADRRRVSIAAVVVALAALGIRLVGLGRQALWSDELQRVTWAKGYEFDLVFGVLPSETGARLPASSLARALEVVSKHNPPLNTVILNLWFRTVGDTTDFLTRLPSALFGAACSPVMYFALRRGFGEEAAILVAALVAASAYQIHYSQEVNHYALASFCVALSFYFYFEYEERPRASVGVGWALAITMALYTHYYAAIVLLFQGLGLGFGVWARRMSLLQATWPVALAVALFLPYVPTLRAQLPELTSTAQIGTFQVGEYFFGRLRAMATMPFAGELGNHTTWLAAVPIAALSATLCALGIAQSRPSRRALLLVNLVGPLVFVVVAFFVRKQNSILWPRYQLFFSFAVYICIGLGLTALRGAARGLGVVLAALFFAGNVYRQNLVYSLARYLRSESRLFGIVDTAELEQTLDVITASEPARQGIWYASAWPDSSALADRMRSFLASHYERCEQEPVDPGPTDIDLHLTHCATRRMTEHDPAWWMPRPGPLQEGGWLETRSPSGFGGWVFSSYGLRAIRVIVDGKTIAEAPHPGLGRPDVSRAFSTYPRDLTEPSGFFVPARVDEGALRRARVAGVRADGSLFPLTSPGGG
jgi:4-amino-4-deoxy-L-arabinose transferase-like glycosyltransferase